MFDILIQNIIYDILYFAAPSFPSSLIGCSTNRLPLSHILHSWHHLVLLVLLFCIYLCQCLKRAGAESASNKCLNDIKLSNCSNRQQIGYQSWHHLQHGDSLDIRQHDLQPCWWVWHSVDNYIDREWLLFI